jgi:carnitine O-acetyltransferase
MKMNPLHCWLLLFLCFHCIDGFSSSVRPPSIAPSAFWKDEDDTPPEAQEDSPRSSPFRPWNQPVYVCHGDYQEQAFLEQHIGGPLYAHQHELPALPLPTLEETLERLIPTAIPLAQNEDEAAQFTRCCQDFIHQAQVLQERLVEKQQEMQQSHKINGDEMMSPSSNASWLQELWQSVGYLQARCPLPVHVSYYLFVPDDKTLNEIPPNGCLGVARAAAVLHALAESRRQICSGSMLQESVGGNAEQHLCSTGFKYLFHSCRIPQPHQDVFHIHDPSLYQHCIVASKGQFYRVEFVDKTGDPLPLTVLEQRLQACVELSSKQQSSYPQLGWLTSLPRDEWAEARQELLALGKEPMEKALTTLENAAFILNLDDEAPDTWTEKGVLFWHGGDNGNGANRWFDKTVQILCTQNGHIAYLGEHAMLDAAPAVPVITKIIKTTYKRLKKKQNANTDTSDGDRDTVVNIFEPCWKDNQQLVEKARNLSSKAKQHHQDMTSSYDKQVFVYDGWGKKFLKQTHLGPEVVSLAMQLASYRLLGTQVGTYEAALARRFYHGRTDTARPVSAYSSAFVDVMGKAPYQGDEENKVYWLREAALVHQEIQDQATIGLGVDRHLFGLSLMQDENDRVSPSLFSDPLYVRAKPLRMSTSTVCYTPGFGPVADDGIGVGYQVAADTCMFAVSSLTRNGYVNPFCDLLKEALDEIGELLRLECTQ